MEYVKRKIAELRQSGLSYKRIGELVALSESEYNSIIRKMQINGEMPPKKSNKERVREALESGETNPYKISEELGISKNLFYRYRTAVGYSTPRPKRNYKVVEKTRQIERDIRLSRASLSEIARRHGVSKQYVWQIKKKMEL